VRRAVPPLLALAIASCGGDSGDGGGGGTSAGPEQPARSGRPGPSTTASGGFPRAPACRRSAEATPEQTEGPYYKEGPPKRRSLLGVGVSGRRLSIRGRVLSTDCTPVARARVDFWQADGKGEYDNDGYRLRGHQFTDGRGRYELRTIVPGLYGGRTRHIHVKVQPSGGRLLTTQVFFPGEPENSNDGIFDEALVMSLRGSGDVRRGRFDFVLETDS
jgi:protocatechuate 3,4-dioxygenase beta subunit